MPPDPRQRRGGDVGESISVPFDVLVGRAPNPYRNQDTMDRDKIRRELLTKSPGLIGAIDLAEQGTSVFNVFEGAQDLNEPSQVTEFKNTSAKILDKEKNPWIQQAKRLYFDEWAKGMAKMLAERQLEAARSPMPSP